MQNANLNLITTYFPSLSPSQLQQLHQLKALFSDWNTKINLISRKDIDNLEERHVLHSLGIAKAIRFVPGTHVLDVGTGGGFPGLPLAICFPDVRFMLIDSIGKKIKVVKDLSRQLGLRNVTARQVHSNELKEQFDFVISRAVTAFPKFLPMVQKNIHHRDKNGLPNGILYLKGGDITEELRLYSNELSVFELSDYFEEEFFKTKKLLYLPV